MKLFSLDRFGGTEIGNRILHRSFRKTEISWAVFDISKAVGPIIDLFFVSQFIGPQGVTVLGYVTPLLMFLELIGSTIANGSRVKVSSLMGFPDRANDGGLHSQIHRGNALFCESFSKVQRPSGS